MKQEERPFFQPHYLTIAEIREMYQKKNKPLNADTLLATLEPLAGTSFLKHTNEVLKATIGHKPTALDLFVIFYGLFSDNVKCENERTRVEAAACLYLLSGFSVPLDFIYTMKWMEPDELLFREYRSDFLYFDAEKTQLAGTHSATQFRFYKAGNYRHAISVSMIEYQEEQAGLKRMRCLTQLSEGVLPHAHFSDVDKPPLPFLDPGQSAFLRTQPLLFISPGFSLDATRGKRENPSQGR